MSVDKPTSFKPLSDEIKSLLIDKEVIKADDKTLSEKIDFINEGLNHWSKFGPTILNSYERGEVISNYNSVSEFDHLSIFTSITRVFKEIIQDELVKREIETSSVRDCFELIEISFKLLSNQIEKDLASLEKERGTPIDGIDVNLFFASLQGFVNSYLQRINA